MRKAFVVLNPVSGNSQPEIIREILEQRFADADWTYQLYETTGQERIADIVPSAVRQGFDLLVAAGGDGTVSGVADAAAGGGAHAGVPLGIIPVGTGNALARDLGIPLDVEGALDLLLGQHTVKHIDALQVGDRLFVLNVSVGVSARIMRETDSDTKRQFGRMAYVWNALGKLFGLKRYHFTLTLDGQDEKLRVTELLILNSKGIGSPYLDWGPDIHPDDGRVEVLVLRPRAVSDYFSVAWNLVVGRKRSDASGRWLSAKQHIFIRVDQPLAVQGDGEVIGQTPVEVRVVPGAVQVVAPRTEKTQ